MPTNHNRNPCLLLLILFLLLAGPALADIPTPDPPKVTANGYLLFDFNSGRILAEQNSTQRLEPASLTKIMTAYAVFREIGEGNISLDDKVLVSEKAWRTPGSRMFIEVGRKVSVESLLKGMIIQSGNDASMALAEHVAGSEQTFAEVMNHHAQRLGMTNTHFVNSTGLPHEDHYTTASDIAKISVATIREFPEFYRWYAEKEFSFNDIKQHNRNKLLWRDESVDGLKTGHTEAAGYCLAASAMRNGMRLISVIMGTESEKARAKESQTLLNYGFRFFETHRLYGAGDALSHIRVWKGAEEKLALGLKEEFYVTISRRQYKKMKAEITIEPHVTAPIEKGEIMGRINVSLAGEPVAEVPLIALKSVKEGSLWQRTKDTILLWFE